MACTLIVLSTLWLATFGLLSWRCHAMHLRYQTMLSSTPMESGAGRGEPLVAVSQSADGSIRLRGLTAAIRGDTLALEARYGNLGYWHSDNDVAVWTFRVDHPATFAVSLDYACFDASAGNRYESVSATT